MTLAALFAIFMVHLAAAMSPGPAVLLAARTALREGMMRGTMLSVGIGIGAVLWAVAALFGLALLFQIAPTFLVVFKIIGAAYLLFLAYKIWKHAPEPLDTNVDAAQKGLSNWGLVRLGITTQLANPKPALFFGTIFLTFMPATPAPWVYPVVLGIIFFNDCGWNVFISRVFSLERTRQTYIGLKTSIDRVFGGLLAALGVKLALT